MNTTTYSNNQNGPSPTKTRVSNPAPSARSASGPAPPPKPEDKEHPDYKKKQALAKGPLISLAYDNSDAYSMTGSLYTALKDVFEAVITHESRTGIASPHKFLEVLRREHEMFRTPMHQDAHEFLNLLLNEVVDNVEENKKRVEVDKQMNGTAIDGHPKDHSAAPVPETDHAFPLSPARWVHELFEGTLTSETRCLTCENVSQRDEPFLDLSVDIEQHSSVTACLRRFSEEEMLCERNKFHCDNCGGLQEAEKRMKIKKLPRVLALHLKRFKYTEDMLKLNKLFHRVVYPYHLRLFNTTDDAEDPDRLYELYAVVIHIGSGPFHGHYVSVIKTERGWVLFDDEHVEPVDKSFVRNFFGDSNGMAAAYVLFYQETTLEAVKKEQEAEGRTIELPAAIETPKDPVGLGLKTNGILTNGLHSIRSAVSAPSEEPPQMASLDKISTEPTLSQFHTPLEPSATPAVPSSYTPTMAGNAFEVQSKKERAKAEKERKAAEKDQEKSEFSIRKTFEIRRKPVAPKSTPEVTVTADAGHISNTDEEQALTPEADGHTPQPFAIPHTSTSSSGFSRFRPSSMSFSKKPKFLGPGSGSGAREASKDEAAVEDEPAPPEKPKSRFSSLRKKTSSMML